MAYLTLFWQRRLLGLILLLGLAGFVGGLHAQELEDLVDESEREDEEISELAGPEVPGLGEETLGGRLRFPKPEDLDELRFSMDREIDPETYLVGPGDILQLYIWGEWDLAYPLKVDPEGNVLVPSVGIFSVSDQTMAKVKKDLTEASLEKYPGVKVTVTLASMRFFTVYLTGAVTREGGFTINPTTRVFDLIEKAGGYLDELRGSIVQEVDGQKITRVRKFKSYPTGRRSIQLTHSDGSTDIIDQEMFLATGEEKHNPYLLMGDRVNVGFAKERVYLFGGVNRAGSHEFRPGDTIGDYITLARGLRYNINLDISELWRFHADGINTDQLSFSELVGKGPDEEVTYEDIKNIPLVAEDMIFIRTRSHWKVGHTASISGEVQFAGRYRVIPGVTSLRDLVEQAGGLTERASLRQAKLIRTKLRSLPDPEFRRLVALQRVSGLSDMSPEDQAYLKTKARQERGRLAVDFERLFEENDETKDILLQGEDRIVIPQKRQVVSMSGQFTKPGLIDYEVGNTVAFYVELAGGYMWNANRDACRLIRAKTGVRIKLKNNLIVEEGDEIWAPEKPYFNWWQFTRETMRTVAETLTLVVLVRAF